MLNTFLVKFWFHVHGIDVQATLLYPSRTLASTLKRMAATWEHTSPNLKNKKLTEKKPANMLTREV